jgi:CO/xanthine dehydrogenase FAD-binding subunit
MSLLEQVECRSPGSLEEALALQASPETRGVPLAGGTDLMVQWQSGVTACPDRVLDLSRVRELVYIEEDEASLLIGGGVRHAALKHSPLVQRHAPSLAAAAATVGGAQIQAGGTLAGSIANASPAGDLAPSLLVADSSVLVACAGGTRRLGMSDFLRGYRDIDLREDELITGFAIPKLKSGEAEGFRKLGPRAAQAISKVMGAYRGAIGGGVVTGFAVALGSVAPTSIRLRTVEEWVVGRKLDASTVSVAAQLARDEVRPIDDIRSTADYRRWVSGRLVESFLRELGGSISDE